MKRVKSLLFYTLSLCFMFTVVFSCLRVVAETLVPVESFKFEPVYEELSEAAILQHAMSKVTNNEPVVWDCIYSSNSRINYESDDYNVIIWNESLSDISEVASSASDYKIEYVKYAGHEIRLVTTISLYGSWCYYGFIDGSTSYCSIASKDNKSMSQDELEQCLNFVLEQNKEESVGEKL